MGVARSAAAALLPANLDVREDCAGPAAARERERRVSVYDEEAPGFRLGPRPAAATTRPAAAWRLDADGWAITLEAEEARANMCFCFC